MLLHMSYVSCDVLRATLPVVSSEQKIHLGAFSHFRYCLAKDSAVDGKGLARANWMQHDYVSRAGALDQQAFIELHCSKTMTTPLPRPWLLRTAPRVG